MPSPNLENSLQVLDTVAEIHERHDAVKELEKKLLDLHQVIYFVTQLAKLQSMNRDI